MKLNSLFVLILATVFFYSCATTGYNSSETGSQNTTSNSTGNVIAYVLENGERLSTFIETQSNFNVNRYSKYENEPTVRFYKEQFTIFENRPPEIYHEALKEFQQKIPDSLGNILASDEFIDILMKRKIGFFYKIEYNRKLRVWHIEFIGKSTTLKIDIANTIREGMGINNVVLTVNRWMELNNVEDLDAVYRFYINDIDDESIPEDGTILEFLPLGD